MVFPTSMGPQPSSSSCLRLSGKSGQYESRSRAAGGMLSEMVDPTVEENWLKVFAISDSSDESVPFIFISVILLGFFAKLAASLSIVHVFLELLVLESLFSIVLFAS
jgi:hypothetical protein